MLESVGPLLVRVADAVGLLRGEPDTPVLLTIERKDIGSFDVQIVREEITYATIKGARIITNNIGYVRLTHFSLLAGDSLEEALEKLLEQGMTSLILDLRSNPGGPLESAQEVAQLFLEDDALIVSIHGRKPEEVKELRAEGSVHYTDFPMIVLVNKSSASASEGQTAVHAPQWVQRSSSRTTSSLSGVTSTPECVR